MNRGAVRRADMSSTTHVTDTRATQVTDSPITDRELVSALELDAFHAGEGEHEIDLALMDMCVAIDDAWRLAFDGR